MHFEVRIAKDKIRSLESQKVLTGENILSVTVITTGNCVILLCYTPLNKRPTSCNMLLSLILRDCKKKVTSGLHYRHSKLCR